ncbi:MAG: DUF262 domain-containing protein [Lachnospiraceae bacterium]|nr:DUF262 domain-containing protein [Lachnospiraceae bacterium]
MNNEWKMEEFSVLEIDRNLSSKKFVVPRYQRGVVWNDRQRADLVDTIKKGLPFGALLLYKNDDNIYQIIDGLQRSHAVIEFVNNPTQFFDEEDIEDGIIKKIVSLANIQGNLKAQEEKVKELLETWVKDNHKTLDEVERMQYAKFGQVIADEFPTCKGKEFDIGDMIEPMMKNYKDICKKINDTKIPAIVLTGDPDLLPILFERINSKGTQLSKYQIYAATWSGDKFKIDNKFVELVKANRDRYDVMLEGSGDLTDYDSKSFMMQKELDAFEICFGFGKFLCYKWPHLFGKSHSEKQVDSIGFTLINCCLGIKNKDAKSLNTKLHERIGDNINTFLSCIIDTVNIVDDAVGKFGRFKSNTRIKSGEKPLHTEFQIVSIIASVFLLKYTKIEYDQDENIREISFMFEQPNSEWKKKYKDSFNKNVSKIYIMEILQRRWIGTGDKKMDLILSNPSYYTREIRKEEFEKVLDNWYEVSNTERMEYLKIATPKESELLIIATIYLPCFSATQQTDGSNYDIEHLVPQNMIKAHLNRFEGKLKLPISSIGNLCLLPEAANRSKRDKTIYMDKEYLKKSNMTIEEVEEKYSFTEKSDLEWIIDNQATEDEIRDNYMQFIDTRYNRIKEKIFENYGQI